MTRSTLIKAISAYKDSESAREKWHQAKALSKSERHARIGATGRAKLDDIRKQTVDEYQAAQKLRDEVLRELRPYHFFLGRNGSAQQKEEDEEDGAAEIETLREYAENVKTWIDEWRPAFESLRTQLDAADAQRTSASWAPLQESLAALDALTTRVEQLEAAQDRTHVGALEDALAGVDGHFPSASARGVVDEDQADASRRVSTHSTRLVGFQHQLDDIRSLVQKAVRERAAVSLDAQKLRAEQEQLKYKVMEVSGDAVCTLLTRSLTLCSLSAATTTCRRKSVVLVGR